MNETYDEIKARYKLAWQDWYYWPMSDEAGQQAAKDRLDAIGKELNIARAALAKVEDKHE